MSVFGRRLRIGVAILAIAAGASGCTRIKGHQGYLIDTQLIATVEPGVDNRDSVQRVLGRPSFVGQFANRDWYYLGIETRQLAFSRPSATDQTLFHVHFDVNGNVASVGRSGVERVARIDPVKDKTPTLGRERGFFAEFFGNIGRVGAPGGQGQMPNDNTGGP